MRITNIKVSVVAISCIITLSILLGGLWFYKEIYTTNSLHASLDKINSIENYQLVEKKDETFIEIKFKKVDNLQSNFLVVKDSLINVPNTQDAKIKIKDNPNERLNSVWQKSQFAVYQALEQGDFVNMAAFLENTSREIGIQKCNIQMDENNIYINLQDKENYLYKVLERKTDGGGVSSD